MRLILEKKVVISFIELFEREEGQLHWCKFLSLICICTKNNGWEKYK